VLYNLASITSANAGDPTEVGAPLPMIAQGNPAETEPTPWLEEVRRQRQAWEERRHSAREAFEARRRVQDPWGAAQQEAWQEDVQRRRQARREQMEQDREYFRNLAPSESPPWAAPIAPPASPMGTAPWPPGPSQAPGILSQEHPAPAAKIIEPPQPPAPATPPDWDNLWYYRGY